MTRPDTREPAATIERWRRGHATCSCSPLLLALAAGCSSAKRPTAGATPGRGQSRGGGSRPRLGARALKAETRGRAWHTARIARGMVHGDALIAALLPGARRRHWSRHASLASVALGAAGGFLVLSRFLGSERISAFDRSVVSGLGRARQRVSNAIVHGLTFFGSVPGAGGLATTTIAVLLGRHQPWLASQIALGALGGITAELGIKRFFRRERPTLLEHLEAVSSTSFPSGHATAAASIYLTMAFVAARRYPHSGWLIAGAALLATSVGASRVYLGVHWPTDVVSGLAIGTAWACGAEAILGLLGDCFGLTGDAIAPAVTTLRGHYPAPCFGVASRWGRARLVGRPAGRPG